ncbi:glycine-rich protein 5-like isoform X1 [Homalodisca vitripennis]|uniref:glycine-rich protein 5-like isoform X1 n=1 Tax=Homalodisca vitripennis TaxID=197043 RepID=UPI001EEAE358|nr:glycine-rich protein 5-like isoform X1 [Homalodisca vitripennis]
MRTITENTATFTESSSDVQREAIIALLIGLTCGQPHQERSRRSYDHEFGHAHGSSARGPHVGHGAYENTVSDVRAIDTGYGSAVHHGGGYGSGYESGVHHGGLGSGLGGGLGTGLGVGSGMVTGVGCGVGTGLERGVGVGSGLVHGVGSGVGTHGVGSSGLVHGVGGRGLGGGLGSVSRGHGAGYGSSGAERGVYEHTVTHVRSDHAGGYGSEALHRGSGYVQGVRHGGGVGTVGLGHGHHHGHHHGGYQTHGY